MAEESSAVAVGSRNACTLHPLSAVSLLILALLPTKVAGSRPGYPLHTF